ncbi:MAG: 5'-nucleotidase C-terminal domain-containing protein [Actinomycetota bacterium]
MKRVVGILGVIASMLMLSALLVTTPSQAQDGSTITILHNNDGESNLLPDEDGGDPGIARFVARMQQLQADAAGDGVITLTSGDNFLASKEFSAAVANGTPYYDSIALSGLYDAMALGNHDFDFGPDVTADFIGGFDPPIPFLSANADFTTEPALWDLVNDGRIAASAVIETDAGPVGVIGAITPRLPNISSPRGVVVSADVADAVNAEAAALEEAGVNRIILISHLQGLSQDQDLVPQLEGVDVVIAGGGDELLKNDGDTCMPDEEAAGEYPLLIGDVPVVTGPGGYRCIGQLDVTFDGDGNVTAVSGSSVGVGDIDPDPEVQANVVDPLAADLAELSSTVIGTSEVALDGQRSSVRTMSSNEGSLMADAQLAAGQALAADFGAPVPNVAIQNGGGIRNDAVIPPGDITLSDTFDIAPFPNFVVAIEVPRERFKELLENAVSGLPETEGRFAQIAGFGMDVNVANPAREIDHEGDCSLIGDEGSRVTDVWLDDGTAIVEGGEVVPGDPVVLAIADFLARGGDCYPLGDLPATKLGVSYQQALANHIADNLGGTISAADYPEADGRISISDDTVGGTGGGDDGGDDGGELPNTGSSTGPLVIAGSAILAAGALFARESRRFRG